MSNVDRETRIAIVGCGYVADYYMTTLADYPWLRVAGVHDVDAARLAAFAGHYCLPVYPHFEDLLADPRVAIVLNLTNPRAHHEVSRACLEAGKHVYSEKPLAMDYAKAAELVELAEARGLLIASAPCNLLGRAAQTLWRAVRENAVGHVRAVYAELDDGMIHRMPYRRWRSTSGASWPYKDEFEVGCTLEHAGYYLGWLVAMFGRVHAVMAYSDCLIPDKVPGETLEPSATPDFSVGVLKFESGVVARLTTTIVGPHDHRIRVVGDEGVLEVDDCWFNDATVYSRKLLTLRRKTFLSPVRIRYRGGKPPPARFRDTGGNRMDFAAGVAELARALHEGRECRLSARFSLHVSELALALQAGGGVHLMKSAFPPVRPLEWAER